METILSPQKVLVHQLLSLGAEETMIITLFLMFRKSEDAMIDLILYIYDNHPDLVEITRKALEIHAALPEELQ